MPRRIALVVALLVALPLAFATPAGGVVPPRDCGLTSIKGKRYQVKVDQIPCAMGKRYAERYLGRRATPKGYRCRDYPPLRGRVRAYCNDGRRIFFAIRR